MPFGVSILSKRTTFTNYRQPAAGERDHREAVARRDREIAELRAEIRQLRSQQETCK